LSSAKRIAAVAAGWTVFHGYLQFTVLVNEGSAVKPPMFLGVLLMAVLASSTLDKTDQALKSWILSTALSTLLVTALMASPSALGVLEPQLMSLLVSGSIRPMVTVLLFTAPVNLLGCFLGQVVRARVR
jgi:hypothetical protein